MALVVVCGQPCSGKSTAVRLLSEALSKCDPNPRVRIIDETISHLSRTERYDNIPAEKNLRGMVRSEVDRWVSTDTITIVDSLNNIKGYRYELWCSARASATLYCVLYSHPPDALCRQWNTARRGAGLDAYSDPVLDDLLARFEPPDGRNRWDSPLFELRHSTEVGEPSEPEPIMGAVRYLTGLTGGSRSKEVLRPTVATLGNSGGNSMYEMDRATMEVVDAVVDAQREGNPVRVYVGEDLPVVEMYGKTVGLPELRRLRRTFVKLAGRSSLSGAPPTMDLWCAKKMFVDYLNQELDSMSDGFPDGEDGEAGSEVGPPRVTPNGHHTRDRRPPLRF